MSTKIHANESIRRQKETRNLTGRFRFHDGDRKCQVIEIMSVGFGHSGDRQPEILTVRYVK